MTFDVEDTIAAVATSDGPAARGIIRISGPKLMDCLERCIGNGPSWKSFRTPTAFAAEVLGQNRGMPVPCDVYLWPNHRSYTRQPSAELHLINSRPLLEIVLTATIQAGARLARPGEFTQRAFLAGRIDLPQVEAVLGVIDADTQRELQIALAQLAGGLSNPVAAVRLQLLDLLADLEAGLDFVEEDIQFISRSEIESRLCTARGHLGDLVTKLDTRSTTDRLWRCVLVGQPNVGKSSLFNALRGNEAAIVSHVPGTTRDYVMERIALDSHTECQLIDTAGLPAAGDNQGTESPFEEQRVTQRQLERADMLLICLDSSRFSRRQMQILVEMHAARPQLLVLTKSDLRIGPRAVNLENAISVSSRTKSGLGQLRMAMSRVINELAGDESSVVRATSVRCREAFHSSCVGLDRALNAHNDRMGDELVAAELRSVLDDLGQIAGAVYTDDILGRIFSRFCIGK